MCHELCRTGLLDMAEFTVQCMRMGEFLSPAGVSQVLGALPASVPIEPLRGAAFVDALLERTAFDGGGVSHEYFRSRARWIVIE